MVFKISKITLFFLSILSVNAQMYKYTFSREYIVSNEGDTLRGNVKVINSYKVLFKANGAKKFIKIDPNNVKIAFKGELSFYRSEDFTYGEKTEKVFLKELISGDVAFYQFTDSSDTESYYVKKNNDKFRRVNTNNYLTIRKALLLNCDSLPSSTKNSNLTGDYRFNIVAEQISIHNESCSAVENPFKVRYERENNTFFELKIGVIMTNFTDDYYKFIYTPEPNVAGVISNAYTGVTIGVGLQVAISKNIYFNPDLLYTNLGGQYKPYLSGYTSRYISIPEISYSSNVIDFLPAQLIFRSNKYKLNPNLNVCFGARTLFTDPKLLDYQGGTFINPIIGFGIGFDYEFKKRQFLRVSLQYKSYGSNSYKFDVNTFTLSTSSFGLMVSYLLN